MLRAGSREGLQAHGDRSLSLPGARPGADEFREVGAQEKTLQVRRQEPVVVTTIGSAADGQARSRAQGPCDQRLMHAFDVWVKLISQMRNETA